MNEQEIKDFRKGLVDTAKANGWKFSTSTFADTFHFHKEFTYLDLYWARDGYSIDAAWTQDGNLGRVPADIITYLEGK